MKTITKQEAIKLLNEVGHHANVTVKNNSTDGFEEDTTVLNNAMVYNPFYKNQVGMSNNEQNAETAIKFIEKAGGKFKVYSSVFNWATDEYEIQ